VNATSADTVWDNQDECFVSMFGTFDVRRAKALIRAKPRALESVAIADAGKFISDPPQEGQHTNAVLVFGVPVDWPKAMSDETDLAVPVIVCPLRGGNFLIDGWHRVAKAKATGVAELPCVILTPAEAKKVQVR
jgi:hypothetical protein